MNKEWWTEKKTFWKDWLYLADRGAEQAQDKCPDPSLEGGEGATGLCTLNQSMGPRISPKIGVNAGLN